MIEATEGEEKSKFLKEKERICALSYNFGLKSANDHKLDDAIRWLTFSFEYAKQIDSMDKNLLVCIVHVQLKPNLSLYSPYYAEACNEFAMSISAS